MKERARQEGRRAGRRGPDDAETQDLASHLAPYARADRRQAVGQLVGTLLPYLGLWALMVVLVRQGVSYWLVLALAVPAAGLLVRVFIFFHDCCHNSFFASRRANQIVGFVTGALTFTPFEAWRHSHARHHATAGDLDRRGSGDIWTMTVAEYQAAPRRTRLAYRAIRNPLVFLGIGPLITFLIAPRFPAKGARPREANSILLLDLVLALILVVASLTIGLKTYLLVQLPIIWLAGSAGIWLFYVQHQFEGVYWARHGAWSLTRAALDGSSYYRLPRLLQWFTGNIGLHHVHHLQPRIPNYALQACYDAVPAARQVRPLTLRASLRSLRLNLYDEAAGQLVGFRSLRHRPAPAG